VTQKKDIKRQKERLEALKKEAEQEKARAKEAARVRVLADFEKGQLGLATVAAVTTTGTEVQGNEAHIPISHRLAHHLLFARSWDQT
jgi:nitric oxide synthase-interacting protein